MEANQPGHLTSAWSWPRSLAGEEPEALVPGGSPASSREQLGTMHTVVPAVLGVGEGRWIDTQNPLMHIQGSEPDRIFAWGQDCRHELPCPGPCSTTVSLSGILGRGGPGG